MLQIKGFEFRMGYGSEDSQLEPLNMFLKKLDEAKIPHSVNITSTGKGVLYSVLYGDSVQKEY